MNTSEPRSAADGYQGYTEWKHWQGTFQASQRDARYFDAEFRDLLLAGQRVLEIGFGEGRFMDWAKTQGATVEGLEINPEMLAAADRHGHVAHNLQLDSLVATGARYDLIVAFDVLEHWNTDELIANFRAIATLLHSGGRFLARFPNGHSPFGRVYQHGDFSHRSVLSCYKIGYLAMLSGLEVIRISDAARVSSKPGTLRALRHRWLGWQRKRIERRIARLYGTPRLPLGPNLVAVLRKPASNEDSTRETEQ
ncbi:MAG: class I SAM-dependent methyltransferase [Rhodanobacteraceae bacterium]